MNLNLLFNMVARMVARRAMTWGINKGMTTLSRRGKPGQGSGGSQARQARELARKMRLLGRLMRR
jgi:hypothetical protein